MDNQHTQEDSLHGPWPSPAEELLGLYGDDWDIYRELVDSGHHGPWVAKRRTPIQDRNNKLTAASVDLLREQLAAAEK